MKPVGLEDPKQVNVHFVVQLRQDDAERYIILLVSKLI